MDKRKKMHEQENNVPIISDVDKNDKDESESPEEYLSAVYYDPLNPGGPGKGLGEFGEAHYMTMAPNGDIWVADTVRPELHRYVEK